MLALRGSSDARTLRGTHAPAFVLQPCRRGVRFISRGACPAWRKGRGASLHRYPPSFEEIAKLPSTTRLSLKVFLQTNHRAMPNFIISKSDTDNIIDYIVSLKGR
jgi:hypothetical protein